MAKSEKPVAEEESLNATEEEWEDEDPTVCEEIIQYEGAIVPRAQWDLAGVFEAFGGVSLFTHDGKPALYYSVPNRGEGLSVRALRILSAMRGNFDELDIDTKEGSVFEALVGPDGAPVIKKWPAIEVAVRIRDNVAGNVRIGTWCEPIAKLRSDKSGWYPVPDPRAIAVAKAKRQAYAEHFSPIVEPLLRAIKYETGKLCRMEGKNYSPDNKGFFSGEAPSYVVDAMAARTGGAQSEGEADRLRAELPLGIAGRDEITDRLRPLAATFGEAIREEFVKWGTETFTTSVIARWPARRKPEIDAWFKEKAEALDQKLDSERVVGEGERPQDSFADKVAPEPTPSTEETVDPQAILAAAVAGATDRGLSAKQILELKNLAGLTRDEATAEKVADFVNRVKAARPNGKSS